VYTWIKIALLVATILHFSGDKAIALGGSCRLAEQTCRQSAALQAEECCYGGPANNCRSGSESPQACVGRLVDEACGNIYSQCMGNLSMECCVNCENWCNNVEYNGVHFCGVLDDSEYCTCECNNS
jgi:hypothetical protein